MYEHSKDPEKWHPVLWTDEQAQRYFPVQWASCGELPIDEFLKDLSPRFLPDGKSIDGAIRRFCPGGADIMELEHRTFREKKAFYVYEYKQERAQERDQLTSRMCAVWLSIFNRERRQQVGGFGRSA